MAEIKSTLEIIMEKTKGLTMTEEEKTEIRHKELSGKIKGLVQRFLDGHMRLDRFKDEVAALGEEHGAPAQRIIKQEIIGRISLETDNSDLLEMMEAATGMDAGSVKELLKKSKARLEEEAVTRMHTLWEALKRKGISGSAVVPNLDADPEWKEYVSKTTQDFQEQLSGIMG